ncbi:hypothetical protein ACK3Z3_11065, partial [Aeromonas caviae]
LMMNPVPWLQMTNMISYQGLVRTFPGTRVLARAHSQLFGAITWVTVGLFARMGAGLAVPNPADNGFYLAKEPTMVLEGGDTMRGSLPGLINPYGDIGAYDGKTFSNLPLMGGRSVRFLRATYVASAYTGAAVSLVGFDITGPWR